MSNCLEALIGAAIFRAWVARGHETHTVRSFGVFMLGATFFATFVSSFVDAGFVTLIGWKSDPYWDVWRLRFFSNMLATQTIVPAIMATASTDWRAVRKAPAARWVEAAVLVGLIAGDLHRRVHESPRLLVRGPVRALSRRSRCSCGRRCASAGSA